MGKSNSNDSPSKLILKCCLNCKKRKKDCHCAKASKCTEWVTLEGEEVARQGDLWN